MEKESRPDVGGLPANGFVWLAVVAASVFLVHQLPWEGSRPTGPEPKPYPYLAEQDVDARLWQDPIGAVTRGREEAQRGEKATQNAKAMDHPADDLIRAIEKRCDGGNKSVLAIGVMIPGSAYQEVAEIRRRYRYAVLAGLNGVGFVPDDPEHIGYFIPPKAKRKKLLPEFIPYEWLHRRQDKEAAQDRRDPDPTLLWSALVFWLDEDVFGSSSLERFDQLAILAKRAKCQRGDSKISSLQLALLGPAASTELQEMVHDVQRAPELTGNLCEIAFYAYGATAEDGALLKNSKPLVGYASKCPSRKFTNGENVDVHDFFGYYGLGVYRTLGTDKRLAEEIAHELKLRGVEPDKNKETAHCDSTDAQWAHVVMISEWDTVYGRSLPRTMADQFKGTGTCSKSGPDGYPPWIYKFSYLRGLDGQLPSVQPAKDSTVQGKENSDKGEQGKAKERIADEKRIERPEGQGQLDYLRRLSGRLQALQSELSSKGGGEIKAIGVLGSDVYDKLLILQALRSQFPNALFFTTDLDARMLHPQELAWTKNLIVGSNFGLELKSVLQGDIMPFRDSYQTSVYFSTLIALHNASRARGDWIKQERITAWFDSPRVFEIGRGVAFDLNTDSGATSVRAGGVDNCNPSDLSSCTNIHPGHSPMFPNPRRDARFAALGVLVLGLWGLSLATGYWQRVIKWVGSRGTERFPDRFASGASVLLVVLGLALAYWWEPLADWLTAKGKGEPLSFIAGVSLWPTELIRGVSCLISIVSVGWSWHLLNVNLDDISKDLMCQPERKKLMENMKRKARETWPWWERGLRIFSFRLEKPEAGVINTETGLGPQAEAFWHKYMYQGRNAARFWRVLVAVLLYFTLGYGIIQAFGAPLRPFRGTLASDIDRVVTYASVFAMLFLIFFVVDATVFCLQFITELRKDIPDPRWPTGTLKKFAGDVNVAPAHLDSWISMHFIAARTKAIVPLVYYPFIVISLMIIARSSVFDNWTMSPGLIIVIGASVLIVVVCAILLRRGAEVSRRIAIWRLTNEMMKLKGRGDEGRNAAEQIQVMIEQIREFRRGAFAPYSQQPFLRALLLPLSSYGGAVLLEYLASANV